MINIRHLNCVQIESPFGSAIGHCLLLEENRKSALIDSGIGLLETREPEKRLGKELIEITGFEFNEAYTAIKQLNRWGIPPEQVENIVCSHLDPDHIGGLLDFPNAQVHVSKEEYDAFKNGDERYLPQQLAHHPKIVCYEKNDAEWYGFPARRLNLDFSVEIYLIPLFGHTLGHCGVAIKNHKKWLFYVGDAYYLRAEMTDPNHPVDQLASIRAVDNDMRKESLKQIGELLKKQGDNIECFGYHDPTEFSTEKL